MSTNADLIAARAAMADHRRSLDAFVEGLSSSDMLAARRGGWSVGRVLQHVIESEVAYVKLIAHLRGLNAPDLETTAPKDGSDALRQLGETRSAVTAVSDGIDDETLYRLAPLGANEYSVLSVLENIADHDHEHLAQITRLMSAGS